MTEPESYVKALLEIQKTFPVLSVGGEVKVQIKVSQIIEIGKRFHSKGYAANDFFQGLGGLGDFFSKRR